MAPIYKAVQLSLLAMLQAQPPALCKTLKVGVAQIMCLGGDRDGNFVRIEHAAATAAAGGAELVVFPEMVILGWDNPLAWTEAFPIPGADTDRLGSIAKKHKIAMVVGLAEKANQSTLHDSSVLLDQTGQLLSVHRKIYIISRLISPPYTPGVLDATNIRAIGLTLADGSMITVGLLICADTMRGDVVAAMAAAKPQLVAVPFGFSACPSGISNANRSECGTFVLPHDGPRLTNLIASVANATNAVVVGTNSVGQQIVGPLAGQTYSGWSSVVEPGGAIKAVLADRDVEVRVVEVTLPPLWESLAVQVFA